MSLDRRFIAKAYYVIHFTQKLRNCGLMYEINKCLSLLHQHAFCIRLGFPCNVRKLYLENAIFWDVASCRSCVNRRFGGTYRLHLQGRKICERGTSVSRWLQTESPV
jgi:hypothetical protein